MKLLSTLSRLGPLSAACYAGVYLLVGGWIAGVIVIALLRIGAMQRGAALDWSYLAWVIVGSACVWVAALLLVVGAWKFRRRFVDPLDAIAHRKPGYKRILRQLARAKRARSGDT